MMFVRMTAYDVYVKVSTIKSTIPKCKRRKAHNSVKNQIRQCSYKQKK